eukprot:6180129-Pleurochrysis_carterae.AAC.3
MRCHSWNFEARGLTHAEHSGGARRPDAHAHAHDSACRALYLGTEHCSCHCFQINMSDLCPPTAPFFGFMGAAVALIFASARTARISAEQ